MSVPNTHGISQPCVLAGRVLAAIAVVQTMVSLGAATVAWLGGRTAEYRPSQIALALTFAAAGIVLGTATYRDPRRLFLFAAFVAVGAAFARATLADLGDTFNTSLAIFFDGVYPEAFVPALLWQFALDFPRVRRFTSFDVFASRATAVAWLLGALLFGVNILDVYTRVPDGFVGYLSRNHASNVFWSVFAIGLVPALGAILVRSRRAELTERRKVARFALAIAAGTAPVLVSGILRLVLPPFDHWFRTAGPAGRGWFDSVVIAALFTTPILGTMAVIIDRPFELRPVPRLPLARLLSFVGRRRMRTRDQDERLVAACEHLRAARGTREIAATLVRELRRGTGAPRVRVLVPTSISEFTDVLTTGPALNAGTALIQMLCEATRPLDFSSACPLLNLLPAADRDWLIANDVELAAALKRRDGALAAVLLFGRKGAASAFTRRDRSFVTSLAASAAVAWDAEDRAGESTSGGCALIPGKADRDEAAFECRACAMVGDSLPLPCGCTGAMALAALPRCLNGKFLVERRLGTGGMGVVYLARDVLLDREVALKTLPLLRETTVTRLREEARAMATLNHESVATLYGLELWRATPVLVVEYFSGGTLARRLADGPLSPAAAVALAIRLARALVYLHARGVLHRDLKPSNIAFTPTGMPKLLDFGLVTDGSALAGTPAYMPPEAFHGASAQPSFDLWALAVVMLEAMSGLNPLRGNAGRVVAPAHLPAALIAFLERALAPRPESRFQEAVEMLVALEALATSCLSHPSK